MPTPEGDPPPSNLPSTVAPLVVPVLAATLLLATLLLVAWRLSPPAPRPADAPAEEFSSIRAKEVLVRLFPTSTPRPAGSQENSAVGQRLVAELDRLELNATLQQGFECGRYGACAPVTNIVAELPGRTERAIGLMAHYDSIPAGPGAADDGAGVASLLEIARALQHGPPLRHAVLLVFTDGEEVGMLGGRVFARQHPAMTRLDAVINLEARGTRGPSTLFRTSADATHRLAAFDVPRPVASSLAQAVFAQLPNETDLSQLLAADVPGYDLAFLGGAQAYHTRLDSVENLSLDSVQHQGSNALALIRSLDTQEPPSRRSASPAVYFDLLALVVVWWPASAARPLAGTVLALLLAAVVSLVWRQRLTWLGFGLGLALWVSTLVLTGVVAFASYFSLRGVGAIPFFWVAFPGALHAFIGCLAVLGALLTARLARRLDRGELALATLCGWALLGTVAAWWVPGASYLFFVPSFVGALVALAWASLPGDAGASFVELVPLTIAALVWWPIVLQLYPAIGFVALPANALGVALLLGLAAPAWSRLDPRWSSPLLAVGGAGVLLSLIAAGVVPPATSTRPRWTTLAYHQHEDDPARWLLDTSFGSPSPALRMAAPFQPASSHVWPGAPIAALEAPADGPTLSPPLIEVIERHRSSVDRTVRVRARSTRGSHILSLHSPLGHPISVRIEGQPATGIAIGGHRVFACLGVPPSGVEFAITVIGGEPWSGLVVDHLPGLPESAEFLQAARGLAGVPAHFGDETLASTTLSL